MNFGLGLLLRLRLDQGIEFDVFDYWLVRLAPNNSCWFQAFISWFQFGIDPRCQVFLRLDSCWIDAPGQRSYYRHFAVIFGE